jgi:DNA-binding MarR family transcriptional regulator
MDKGFLSTLVKSLQEKALIQVASDPQDSRKKIILVTKKGQKLKEKARNIPATLLCRLGGDETRSTEIASLKIMLDELNSTMARLDKISSEVQDRKG